jgi:hypothetical protein
MLKMFSIWFNAYIDTSEHGLSHPFKDLGAVANSLTGRPEYARKSEFLNNFWWAKPTPNFNKTFDTFYGTHKKVCL